MAKYPEQLIFGLDIGTRSIVGTVGYREHNKFHVIAMAVRYHDTRSMLDGQIHDIQKVSEEITEVKNELESQLDGRKLNEVCIAAAGRVLKTAVGHGEYEFSENTVVTQEYIHSIDLIGVEKAHNIVYSEAESAGEETKYYCVGYTVIKYYLNGYEIHNLEGHRGTRIGADVLATFLPEEVVNSLYSAVELAGLYVANLTLEPIAAIELAIPEQFRLLNIALIDVGAGTSDICITKDGSIIGYGMIPSAGDEMTEALMKKYLVDFNTAEKLKTVSQKKKSVTYKDIMGISHKIEPSEIIETLENNKVEITSRIAEKIIELNGGEPVSAAFVVGGGGKLTGFTDILADHLGIPHERVALRGQEVMNDVDFDVEGFKKDPIYVTPVGICLNYFRQKNNFIFVTVNNSRVKLYNNEKLTIFDAAVQYGFPKESIFPVRGDDVTFKVNGKTRIVRGYNGEAATIEQNGSIVGMNAPIEANDKITITPSTKGKSAEVLLGSLPEYSGTLQFTVNDAIVTCPKFALVNGQPQSELYSIQNDDEVEMQNFYTLEQLYMFMDIEPLKHSFINNKEATLEDKIYDNFIINWLEELPEIRYEEEPKESKNEEAVTSKEVVEKTDITKEESSLEETLEEEVKPIIEMPIMVNMQPVLLKNKSEYTFVDIFEFYDFDLSSVKGSRLITNVDGHHASFTEVLHEGAMVDIYWEK